MKTIELDLEKEENLNVVSRQIRNKNIQLGKERFELIIYSYIDLTSVLYGSFLLTLSKYMRTELNKTHHEAPDLLWEDKLNKQYFEIYFKHYDINKLENKIEKEFNFEIELEKKNPTDEVFGIWKNENVNLETIRKKAWQRAR